MSSSQSVELHTPPSVTSIRAIVPEASTEEMRQKEKSEENKPAANEPEENKNADNEPEENGPEENEPEENELAEKVQGGGVEVKDAGGGGPDATTIAAPTTFAPSSVGDRGASLATKGIPGSPNLSGPGSKNRTTTWQEILDGRTGVTVTISVEGPSQGGPLSTGTPTIDSPGSIGHSACSSKMRSGLLSRAWDTVSGIMSRCASGVDTLIAAAPPVIAGSIAKSMVDGMGIPFKKASETFTQHMMSTVASRMGLKEWFPPPTLTT